MSLTWITPTLFAQYVFPYFHPFQNRLGTMLDLFRTSQLSVQNNHRNRLGTMLNLCRTSQLSVQTITRKLSKKWQKDPGQEARRIFEQVCPGWSKLTIRPFQHLKRCPWSRLCEKISSASTPWVLVKELTSSCRLNARTCKSLYRVGSTGSLPSHTPYHVITNVITWRHLYLYWPGSKISVQIGELWLSQRGTT